MKALGLIEVYSFTTAVCAADVAAKAADVQVVAFDRNRPISADVPAPLVMAVKIEGNVAAVRAAVEAGSDYAKDRGKFIVSHIISRPDDMTEKMAYLTDINRDKFNKHLKENLQLARKGEYVPKYTGAIGLLEIQGFVASVEALDAMAKAAEVKLIHTERRLGGRLCTLVISGSVSNVKAALDAGKNEGAKLGKVYGCETIANVSGEVVKFFDV